MSKNAEADEVKTTPHTERYCTIQEATDTANKKARKAYKLIENDTVVFGFFPG